jgi:hypothetical protein
MNHPNLGEDRVDDPRLRRAAPGWTIVTADDPEHIAAWRGRRYELAVDAPERTIGRSNRGNGSDAHKYQDVNAKHPNKVPHFRRRIETQPAMSGADRLRLPLVREQQLTGSNVTAMVDPA